MTELTWGERIARDKRRVVILDDDPTGTQTVSGVAVILRPNRDAYRAFFGSEARAAFVLTNTRAMPEPEARALVRHIRREVEEAAAKAGAETAFLLRGDSTLRGHIFAEIDEMSDRDSSVSLFVPAFPEGGRTTVGGVHYLRQGDTRVPVCRTEFAADPVFGYDSERLEDWAREAPHGRQAILVPLAALREIGEQAIAEALINAPDGSVVIPDAETREDLESIASGLLAAEERGRRIVVRCASTFAAIRAGLTGRAAAPRITAARLLIVCGSHTAASTEQLRKLSERTVPPIIVPVAGVLGTERERGEIVAKLTVKVKERIAAGGLAILATERERDAGHGDLRTGARVMRVLTDIVSNVAGDVDGVISKGGITSAQVATDGLGADSAFVYGQLAPGVSLWELAVSGGKTLPYAVVPGNVGGSETIVDVVRQFGVGREESEAGQ
ncbi:four-carbon acid sugar kinase family protein [Cohnella sp. GCM10027633]|uniref:four-carbon acid sugar kinase family protein n=1 Tax=unclassified Cohnella TaxID=2636738 RepID=UPI0036290AAB